jgi:GNAT superfamily N-acetyltransferase
MTLMIRDARANEIGDIVRLLSDDPLGALREDFSSPLPDAYREAFAEINADSNNELVVASQDDNIVGVLQLTFIPYMTYRGGRRALIEGVRVSAEHRSQGIGRKLFEWAIARARDRGCHLLQLTTDKSRPEALSFYEQLGFVSSHHGMKLKLESDK